MKLVIKQLDGVIPDGYTLFGLIDDVIDVAIEKTEQCVLSVKGWSESRFNYLNSGQYSTFLYLLSREVYFHYRDVHAATKLFLLNKALNGIDLFYEVELPQHFLIGHTVGMVFAKAKYGDFCVFHQACTIGRQDEARPSIGRGVILYPGSSIIGRCDIGDNVVVSAGVHIVNKNIPDNCFVFNGPKGLVLKELGFIYADKYFNCN